LSGLCAALLCCRVASFEVRSFVCLFVRSFVRSFVVVAAVDVVVVVAVAVVVVVGQSVNGRKADGATRGNPSRDVLETTSLRGN